MQREIIEHLRTQSEPVTFAEIREVLLVEYGTHPTLTHEASKALRLLLKRGRIERHVVGYHQTRFSGVAELPVWGYVLATS